MRNFWKRLVYSLLLVLLVLLQVMTVSAHSGGTDSSGGHTDHSTGKYHYHHGYPEHHHWDMDGDGDIDCPYTFYYAPVPESDCPSDATEEIPPSEATEYTSGATYDWPVNAYEIPTFPSISYETAPIPSTKTPPQETVPNNAEQIGSSERENKDTGIVSIILPIAFLLSPVFIVLGIIKYINERLS